MEIVTTDLSKYGYTELIEAAELLKAYSERNAKFLGDGLTLNFNMNSGYVFLSDEDYNVGLLTDDGKLEQFFSCSNCGFEGFKEDFIDIKQHETESDDCLEQIEEVKK